MPSNDQIENTVATRRTWQSQLHTVRGLVPATNGRPLLTKENRRTASCLFHKIDKPEDFTPNVVFKEDEKGWSAPRDLRLDRVKVNQFCDLAGRSKSKLTSIPQVQRDLDQLMPYIDWNVGPIPGIPGAEELYGFIKEDALKPDSGINKSNILRLLRVSAQHLGIKSYILPGDWKIQIGDSEGKVIPILRGGYQTVKFMDGDGNDGSPHLSEAQMKDILSNPDDDNKRRWMWDNLDLSDFSASHRLMNGRLAGQKYHYTDKQFFSKGPAGYQHDINRVLANVPARDKVPHDQEPFIPNNGAPESLAEVFDCLASTEIPGHVESLIARQPWEFIGIEDGGHPSLVLYPSDNTSLDKRKALDEMRARVGHLVAVRLANGMEVATRDETLSDSTEFTLSGGRQLVDA